MVSIVSMDPDSIMENQRSVESSNIISGNRALDSASMQWRHLAAVVNRLFFMLYVLVFVLIMVAMCIKFM